MIVGEPWLFDNKIFTLVSLDESKQLTKINFDTEHFLIQLHGLPVRYTNRFYNKLIGNTIGRVLDVDVGTDDTRWGSFFRVKVDLNLTKPSAHGRKVTIMEEDLWIPVKYEKFLKFCFGCNRILHEEGRCLIKDSPSIE